MTTLVEERPELKHLIDRVLAGEEITLTREGVPIVQLVPARRRTFDAAWFRANRVTPQRPADHVETIRQMRDDRL